jgi:hypothetical protein
MKKTSWMQWLVAGSILAAAGAALAAPPPTGPQRNIPVKVTERYTDGTQYIYNTCLVFNPGGTPGVLYALGDQLTWNYGKLGLDKGRFEAVSGSVIICGAEELCLNAAPPGLMLYGKFPETNTSSEAPGTPKMEGIYANGTTLIMEPKAGTCSVST